MSSNNAWLQHVAQFRKSHPGMKKGVLKAARKTYKKGQKGGSFLSDISGAFSAAAPFAPLLMGLGKRKKRQAGGAISRRPTGWVPGTAF